MLHATLFSEDSCFMPMTLCRLYVRDATPKSVKLECCMKTACSTVVRCWVSQAVLFLNHSAKWHSVVRTLKGSRPTRGRRWRCWREM